jgi:hypothetical protein
MLLASFGVGQVVWSIVWFFIFFLWLMLLFQVTLDIFRSHDLSGPAKALWILLVLVFPYLGVLLYVIFRGGKMHEHQVGALREQQLFNSVASPSPSEELHRLADLRDRGVIDDDEFGRLKAKIIG